MNEPQHPQLRLIEALLLASPTPVSYKTLLDRIGDDVVLGSLLSILQEDYAHRGIQVKEIDGTYSFRTAPDLAPELQIISEVRRKLPRVAAETLAIIAYHQPVTRAEIETIRGVATASGTLDILLERGWIRPGRRRDTVGRPVTWVTTLEFLSHFNLTSLQDLPGLEELKASGMLDPRPVMAGISVSEDDTRLRDHNVTTDTAHDSLYNTLNPTTAEFESEPVHWVAEDEVVISTQVALMTTKG